MSAISKNNVTPENKNADIKIRTIGKSMTRTIKVIDSKYERKSFVPNGIISDSDLEMDVRAEEAARSAIKKAKVCKKPIARYDKETKRAYVEYSDGGRKLVE